MHGRRKRQIRSIMHGENARFDLLSNLDYSTSPWNIDYLCTRSEGDSPRGSCCSQVANPTNETRMKKNPSIYSSHAMTCNKGEGKIFNGGDVPRKSGPRRANFLGICNKHQQR